MGEKSGILGPPVRRPVIPWRFVFGFCLLAGLVILKLDGVAGEAPVPSAEQKDLDFANGLYQRGMYANAAKQYGDFLTKYPKSPFREIALFRQGESFYQQAVQEQKENPVQAQVTYLKARSAFTDFIRAFPQSERIHEALLRQGEIAYKAEDYQAGVTALQRVIKESKNPTLLEAALFYSARCLENLGKAGEAETRYRQIRSTYPQSEYAAYSTYLLADLLAKRGAGNDALPLLNELTQKPARYPIPEGSNLAADAQLLSAQVLYQLNRYAEAADAYMAYVKDHPASPEAAKARYGAAWAEYQQKNYARVLEIAGSLQRQSLPPELVAGILFLQGTCSYQQKQYHDAILHFREVIAHPHAGEYRERAWFQLAWAYYLSGRLDAARTECENLLRQELPSAMGANIHFLLGQIDAQQNEFASAIQEMNFVLKLDPGGEYGEEALYLLADLHYRMARYQEAGDLFEQFQEKYPKSLRRRDAMVWAAHSRFAAKDYEKAAAAAQRALEAYPDLEAKADMLYRKALSDYQLKRYDAALQSLEEILKLSRGDAKKTDALYWKAYIYEITGRKKEASAAYGQLIANDPPLPNLEDIRLRKALCDYAEKDLGPAYEGFHQVLFSEKGNQLPAEVLFWMILQAEEKKDYEEALKIAERALEIFHQPAIRERALIAIGNQRVALQQWNEAVANAEAFIQSFPDSLFKPEVYWTLAKGCEGIGDRPKALEWYEKSLAELQKLGNPDPAFEATLYVDRGRLLENLDRPADALESFLRVAIIYDHPELTPEAMYRSIRCHRKVGENTEARNFFNELLKRYPSSEWAKKARDEFDFSASSPESAVEIKSATPAN
ncbi:MAG TPA: tetratricopeptide repeat protein [bacterium]|nr:tetratricopeptide repeat protein [Candidatus Omnitrophota bacterium]HOJ59955.1 tetratricopeptide repeat protein [bacterium]HOL94544.1 tetratricopeptide repeat protein [bacterium]HPP02440.1 tetratricopeptide repeat protein [bacterium]HXK92741.1 tetratricopeptide repeat protein [bacterium]